MNKLNHVAFIMDGNGRWGQRKNRGRNFGHLNGVKTVKKIVETSVKLKIPVVTFYVFSTENWRRPKAEINFLFNLITSYFKKELKNIITNDIKINIIGKFEKLPVKIKTSLKKAIKLTKKNKKIIVNLAINYGAQNEIIQAFKKTRKNLSIKNFEKQLYTKNMPNPDILIRTGGYRRLSNFLLWQLAYTELFFLKKLWPDFSSIDLLRIINQFKNIKRNFGKV